MKKPDITYGQLLGLSSKLRRQWYGCVSIRRSSKTKAPNETVMTLKVGNKADMVPTLEGILASKYATEIYVDGGAQVCVLIEAMMEKIGAKVSTQAHIRMRMANHKKAKCLGIAQGIKVKVLDIDSGGSLINM